METLTALLRTDASGAAVLAAPKLGVFARQLANEDLVRPGTVLGTLRVLQRRYRIIAPAEALGVARSIEPSPARPVGYGETLVTLGELEAGASIVASADRAARAAHGGDFSLDAPIHGIFYRRSSPEAAPYVEAGQRVSRGQTVGLIEVMKTFNPVVYDGPNLPDSAEVVEVVAGEREEVEAGAVLITLRA